MPSEHIEAARRAYEAFRAGDMESLLREVHPDVEVSDPERAGAGPFRGHDAYLAWLAEWMESWESYEVDVEALVDAGDKVVALAHQRGRARGSGIEIDAGTAALHAFRDGKISFYRLYTDRAEALEAAGLRDAPVWLDAIERALTGYSAFNRRDFDAVRRIIGPDVEVAPVRQSPDMPTFRSGEGLDSFLESARETWEQFRFTPVAFVPAEDRLLVHLDVNAKARASGIELQERWAHVYTLRNGTFVRLQAFTDTGEALEVLAYPERP
jgi:ketosteroid isomerase-like protein